jgi:hypothetical protein
VEDPVDTVLEEDRSTFVVVAVVRRIVVGHSLGHLGDRSCEDSVSIFLFFQNVAILRNGEEIRGARDFATHVQVVVLD